MIRRWTANGVVLLGICTLAGVSSAQEGATAEEARAGGTIKIGVINSLTGRFTPFGEPIRDGLTQAVAEINAAGGIKGKKIELVVEDDHSEPDQAVKAFEKLAAEKVAVIIGPISSDATRATAKLATRLKIPQISPSAHESSLAKAGPYTYLIHPTTEDVAKHAAELVAKQIKAKRVAILNPDTEWGKASTAAMQGKLRALGVKAVSVQKFSEGQKDFTEQLKAIAETKPNVIVYPGYYEEESVAITDQIKKMGLLKPAATPTGTAETTAVAAGPISLMMVGEACAMVLQSAVLGDPDVQKNLYFVNEPTGSATFQKSFEARFKHRPSPYAAAANASLFLVTKAIEAGGAQPAQVQKALKTTQLPESSFGKVAFKGSMNTATAFELQQLSADKQLQPVR